MTMLPDTYDIDYLVHSVGTLLEEDKILDMPFNQVVKKAMLKKFDSWVEGEIVGRQL